MSLCLGILYIYIIVFLNCIIIDPSSKDDYVEITLDQNQYNQIVNNSWYLKVDNSHTAINWPLAVKLLSNKYSFKPHTKDSFIKIEMNVSTISNQLDMYYTFAVNDQYFSFAHDSDGGLTINTPGIFIFPQCSTNLPIGNTSTIISKNVTHITRAGFYSILSNGNASNWYKLTNKPNKDTWPVTFKLINDDIDKRLHIEFWSETLNLTCTFANSFEVNSDFHMYVSPEYGDFHDEECYIHYFNFTASPATEYTGNVNIKFNVTSNNTNCTISPYAIENTTTKSICSYFPDNDIFIQYQVSNHSNCEYKIAVNITITNFVGSYNDGIRFKFKHYIQQQLNKEYGNGSVVAHDPYFNIMTTPGPTDNSTEHTTTCQFTEHVHTVETGNSNQNILPFVMIIVIVLITIWIIVLVIYCRKRLAVKNEANTLYVANALVAIIAIGEYSLPIEKEEKTDIDGYLMDLPIEMDIDHLEDLFTLLNYKLLPIYRTLFWKENKLISFIKDVIGKELFDNNKNLKYDGLIVCISSHGLQNSIITSDYCSIEKTAIHRLISNEYPLVREIPRIFIFDSCSGNAQRERIRQSTINSYNQLAKYNIANAQQFRLDEIEFEEINKAVKLDDVSTGREWTTINRNPDYNLVQIDASNPGYQAKCSKRVGSLLIYEFTKRMKQNIEQKQNKSLLTICAEIQNNLHDRGKQQTTNVFNNHTRDLRFKINKNKGVVRNKVEMNTYYQL